MMGLDFVAIIFIAISIGGSYLFGRIKKGSEDKELVKNQAETIQHQHSIIVAASDKMEVLADHQSTIDAIRNNNKKLLEKGREAKDDEEIFSFVADIIKLNNSTARMQNTTSDSLSND